MLNAHLRLQELSHAASRVSQFLVGTDSLDFWASELAGEARVDGGLLECLRLVERAFGLSERRPGKRVVPSAGARYPIDLVLLTREQGVARALLYDPWQRRLYALKSATSERLGERHAVLAHEVHVLLVAVFQLSVERYGARGARYCLIEAGYVASNCVETAYDETPAWEPAPSAHLCGAGADVLTGAAAIACVVLRGTSGACRSGREPVASTRGPRFSPTPWFSENMIRAEQFYLDSRRAVAPATLPTVSVTRSVRRAKPWQAQRSSCKGFAPERLPAADLLALENFSRALVAASDAASAPAVALTLFENNGQGAFSPTWQNHGNAAGHGAVSVAELQLACNQKNLIQNATLVMVLSLAELLHRKEAAAALSEYYRGLLHVGVLSSDIYRFCALRGIGTTIACGFEDSILVRALGLEEQSPLALHVFGVSDEHARKTDLDYARH